MSDSNWYSENDWYMPAYKSAAPGKSSKRGWTRWRTVGALVLALALIAGTSVAFSSGKSRQDTSYSDSFGGFNGGDADDAEGMPKDWKDFFEDYYESVQNEATVVDVPRYDGSDALSVNLTATSGDELEMREIYAKCADSVVAITGYTDEDVGYSWGSGIILSEDGFILTNTHIINGCNRAVVTLVDDVEYEAQLVGADGISDVALLKIDASGLPTAELGDSAGLSVGDKVVAIGNPLGESFRLTMTDGIISAIERGINYNGHSMTLMQTNAALNEGNSGGALFNMYGQVVGVTNMKMMSAYSSIEGIGFAIPSSTVKTIVDELMKNGEVRGRPSIGITVGAIPDAAAEYYEDLPSQGLYVSDVVENSDAAAKGIAKGDIITAVNGVAVATTDDVNDLKNGMQVGETITFTVWRDGETFDVEVALMDTNDIYG